MYIMTNLTYCWRKARTVKQVDRYKIWSVLGKYLETLNLEIGIGDRTHLSGITLVVRILFFFDLRIPIIPLVSSNSSFLTWYMHFNM